MHSCVIVLQWYAEQHFLLYFSLSTAMAALLYSKQNVIIVFGAMQCDFACTLDVCVCVCASARVCVCVILLRC